MDPLLHIFIINLTFAAISLNALVYSAAILKENNI